MCSTQSQYCFVWINITVYTKQHRAATRSPNKDVQRINYLFFFTLYFYSTFLIDSKHTTFIITLNDLHLPFVFAIDDMDFFSSFACIRFGFSYTKYRLGNRHCTTSHIHPRPKYGSIVRQAHIPIIYIHPACIVVETCLLCLRFDLIDSYLWGSVGRNVVRIATIWSGTSLRLGQLLIEFIINNFDGLRYFGWCHSVLRELRTWRRGVIKIVRSKKLKRRPNRFQILQLWHYGIWF